MSKNKMAESFNYLYDLILHIFKLINLVIAFYCNINIRIVTHEKLLCFIFY